MIPTDILEEMLQSETSRKTVDMVADLVTQRPELFENLVSIFLRDEEPVSRRAAWVVDIITEAHPQLLPGLIDLIIPRLSSFSHDGMKRPSMRMLTRVDLTEVQMDSLVNLCFEWLTNPKESVSVKVYSMELLYQFSHKEPDLRKELADSIEWRFQEETPGFRNRGGKILKKLYREMK
jgi:hypothetical protein